MNKLLKPMLSAKAPDDLSKLKFPLYASNKIDGIRATVQDGKLVSRSLKLIPNKHIQSFDWSNFEGLDGELIIGAPNDPDVYRTTNSIVMSHNKESDWQFYVFDYVNMSDVRFASRCDVLEREETCMPERFTLLQQTVVNTVDELLEFETQSLTDGYEGVIIKNPFSSYKHGRSTLTKGESIKLKRFSDGEARIINSEPKFHNANKATTNELGRTHRSSHKENQVALDELGSFVVADLKTNIEFNVGTGFTAADRIEFWQNKKSLIGKIIKYKYFEIGVKDKPRHPVFQGFRDLMDMS